MGGTVRKSYPVRAKQLHLSHLESSIPKYRSLELTFTIYNSIILAIKNPERLWYSDVAQ